MLALSLAPRVAEAQVGFGQPGGGMGGPGGFSAPTPGSSSSKKKPAKKPEEETHAASNTEAVQSLQTQEPTLPQNPLEIPKGLKDKIGTDYAKEPELGRGPKTERDFYGLYYQEKSDKWSFRTIIPPLWAERRMPNDRASIFGLYYNRRSEKHDADVLFPFFWRLRDDATTTTVVFPFLHRERKATKELPARHDNWLFPLFFEGKSANGSGYFHLPALLTFTQHSARGGLDIAGPMFCRWKGGPNCDRRTADSMDMGLAPFYFYGKDETSEYEVIPPLIHYYKYNEIGDKTTTLWGPVYLTRSPDEDVTNVFPFFWRSSGKNESHTTLFPFFHYGYKGTENLLITPFFVKATGEKGEKTFASVVYAKYRGRTELDMVTPFYWAYRDPDIGLDRKLIFPFYYENTSPRSKDRVVFPFYARFQRAGLSDTTWVTPLFRHVGDVTGWETDIFPFFYAGRKNDTSHLVVAPLLFDFNSPHSRFTLVPPVYLRMADTKSVTQVALNTYYHEKKVPGGTDWEFHFFPLFSYGQSPTGHWWNVLYGLAGYTREGTSSKVRALYIPFKLSE
ncbi:Hypothetical protein A7982_03823 [Minicystis rosea]|nr:Hypothetical protein A7982_03823 [Minicystis rosea]